MKNGRYDEIANFREFARTVTKHMLEMSRDRHLQIYYARGDVSDIRRRETISDKERIADDARQNEAQGKRNFGFAEVKILPANIGNLCLNEFVQAFIFSGRNDLTIENYEKSLRLNPENANARLMLEKLKK